MDPWYSVQDTNNFEINVYFKGSSLEIKPYYKFHLGLLGEILKANPELSLVITHGGSTSFSLARSQRLYRYFYGREGIPLERIFVYEGLSPRYSVEKGERVLIYLKEVSQKKMKAPIEKKKPLVNIESDKFIVEPEGESEEVEILESEGPRYWMFDLGLGYREYRFKGRSTFSAYILNFNVGYQLLDQVKLKLDLEGGVPDVKGDASSEYDARLGLDTEFENVELESRIYHKSNFIWIDAASGFDMITDYGLSQKIGFKLFSIYESQVKIGFLGEVSFSNNVSSVESANVYKYSTEFEVSAPKSSLSFKVYFSTQKYKTPVEILDADIFGARLVFKY